MSPRSELAAFVTAALEARLGVAPAAETDLFALGLDSVGAIETGWEIEARIGREIDPELLFEHRTVAAIVEAVTALLGDADTRSAA